MAVVSLGQNILNQGYDFDSFDITSVFDHEYITADKGDFVAFDNWNERFLTNTRFDFKPGTEGLVEDRSDGFVPLRGVLSGFSQSEWGRVVFGVSDISIGFVALYELTLAGDPGAFFERILSRSDLITGSNFADNIYSLGGNDVVNAGLGMDTISGGVGNDRIYAGDDSDLVWGEAGDDRIYGESGIDVLKGGRGNDTLVGGAGDDLLSGGWGQDSLDGGAGNDLLVGGRDSESDTFVFKRGYGNDRCLAFELADSDVVQLDDNLWAAKLGVLTAQEVVEEFAQINVSGTIITFNFGGGNILEICNSSAFGGLVLANIWEDILII